MRRKHEVVDRSTPLTELIAGFSLCMLAAAFGAILGPEWSRQWAIFGAFGLASAVGLDVFRRTQDRLKEQIRKKEMAVLTERNLNKVANDLRSSTTIRDALRKVQDHAVAAVSPGRAGSAEPRLPAHKQVRITLLRERTKTPQDWSGDSFTGYVRDISSCGIGLAHSRHLEPGPVLLAFELRNGEQVTFITEVLWCESQGDGQYFSGGKLRKVLSPEEAQSEIPEAVC